MKLFGLSFMVLKSAGILNCPVTKSSALEFIIISVYHFGSRILTCKSLFFINCRRARLLEYLEKSLTEFYVNLPVCMDSYNNE